MDQIMHECGDEHGLSRFRQAGHAEPQRRLCEAPGKITDAAKGDTGFIDDRLQHGRLPPGPHKWGEAKWMTRRALEGVKSLRCQKELKLAGDLRPGRKLRPVVSRQNYYCRCRGRKFAADCGEQSGVAPGSEAQCKILNRGIVPHEHDRRAMLLSAQAVEVGKA